MRAMASAAAASQHTSAPRFVGSHRRSDEEEGAVDSASKLLTVVRAAGDEAGDDPSAGGAVSSAITFLKNLLFMAAPAQERMPRCGFPNARSTVFVD